MFSAPSWALDIHSLPAITTLFPRARNQNCVAKAQLLLVIMNWTGPRPNMRQEETTQPVTCLSPPILFGSCLMLWEVQDVLLIFSPLCPFDMVSHKPLPQPRAMQTVVSGTGPSMPPKQEVSPRYSTYCHLIYWLTSLARLSAQHSDPTLRALRGN